MANPATIAPAVGASTTIPLLYPIPQAAALLGIGAAKLWLLVREERVRVTKIDRRTLIARAELERIAAEGL